MRTLLLFFAVGCGTTTFTAEDGGANTMDGASDAATMTDSGNTPFHCTGAWIPPQPFTELNMAGTDNTGARLTYDGLNVVFSRNTGVGADILTAGRSTPKGTFGSISTFGMVNTSTDDEVFPMLVGAELFFVRANAALTGIYIAVAPAFANPMPVRQDLAIATTRNSTPWVLPSGKVMYFSRTPAMMPTTIMRMERISGWTDPTTVNLGSGQNVTPAVTPDETRIYFSSDRNGGFDIWTSVRSPKSDTWPAPTRVDVLSSSDDENPTWISPDECSIVLQRRTSGNWSIFYSVRPN